MADFRNTNSSILPSIQTPAPVPAASNLSQIAEDAAGEGGDAVATFSNYTAPLWARHCCSIRKEGSNQKKEAENQPEVIMIDFSNDENDSNQNNLKNDDTPSSLSPAKILSHSSPACESGLLASISAPEPNKEYLTVIRQLAQEGKLSPLQVEGTGLAIQRHSRLFKSSGGGGNYVRAGFFLGDGAGIGKGRQIASILRDSFSRSFINVEESSSMTKAKPITTIGTPKSSLPAKKTFSRRRHLWLSVSRELIEDARRDLLDIGCHISVIDGAEALSSNNGNSNSNSKVFSSGNQQSGVLFITYALLVSGKGKRLEDIIKWLTFNTTEDDFDGCIIFDEAHKAKNLCSDPPTTTGLLVLKLQERLRNARVMYCSATGVSDLKQLGYATRLGLWGFETNYPTFDAFRASFEKKGVGAMEMLALEMKQAGCFVARTLSWDGAEFQSIKVSLTKEQTDIYDKSMEWWELVKTEMNNALSRSDMNGTPKMLYSQYWSAHQRFSKELAISAKIPRVVNDALRCLESGHSVVIGLQSTGEASTQAALEEITSNIRIQNKAIDDLSELILPQITSTAAAIMTGFIRNHFPVAPLPLDTIKVPDIPPNGFTNENERLFHHQMTALSEQQKNAPPPEDIPALILKKQQLLDAIANIKLPPCPLDELIDRLGGEENVSEMTGRSGRILRTKSKNGFKFVRRIKAPKENKYALSMPCSQEDSDRLNTVEKRMFMDGRKKVAIISDAASTGISLHAAAKSAACERRRVHFTIELPWAADKAIQQLGRTHRSGQLSAPIYKMVVTDLGGERRFAAAVAKRMASLGALTKGDRRAASGSDLSEFDIDSRFGRRSLGRLYSCMSAEPPYTPSKGSNIILDAYIWNANDSSLLIKGELDRRLHALRRAKASLETIGIETAADTRKNNSVKAFLNRIAALKVAEQNLVFALFISTLDDVIDEAKATGEFEGSVEQIQATSVKLASQPEVITCDKSSGALTKLMIFNVDRGCSFSNVCEMCLEMILNCNSKDHHIELSTSVARSGFYVSRRPIMGRWLVLFAKRKVKLTSDENDIENRIDYDPRGLMVVTRPNTGTNPCEMSTSDLCSKYNIIASIDNMKEIMKGNSERDVDFFSALMKQYYARYFAMWQETYSASNNFSDQIGLAPRHSKLALITGSVLHCLPALQKSVSSMLRQTDRSLKIMRIETTGSKKQHVGMKFPVNQEVLIKLRSILATLDSARNVTSSNMFVDEVPGAIQAKSVSWVTTEPTTMKNFFKPVDKGSKRKSPSSHTIKHKSPSTPRLKERRTESKRKPSSSKPKSSAITSFFRKI